MFETADSVNIEEHVMLHASTIGMVLVVLPIYTQRSSLAIYRN